MTPLASTATAALEAAGLRLYVTSPNGPYATIDTDGWRVHDGTYADGRKMVRVRIGHDAPADAVVAALEAAGLTVDRKPENYGYVRATSPEAAR